MRDYRIGCGAGFSADRLPPALDLIKHGELDAIIVECVGERTLAFGHRDRLSEPKAGYNPYLAQRLRAMLPLCQRNGVKLVTNMGVANPQAAGEHAAAIATDLGLSGMRIAVLVGDDVSRDITESTGLFEGGTIADIPHKMIGANAYLGIEHMLPAIDADVVITGRVADPSLTLAPLAHHFGWSQSSWPILGKGTLAGHLIECGMQVSGGYFADPGFKDVPDLANCGYPIATIGQDGATAIEKLAFSGGLVSSETVKEQLLYEVHNPAAYITPDVVADFSKVGLRETGRNRVEIAGAAGKERPSKLKVTIGFNAGFLGEAGISYAGDGAANRAFLAKEILQKRLEHLAIEVRYDVIGVSAIHANAHSRATNDDCLDARLRVAARTTDRELLETILWETEALLCSGPSAGGGFRRSVSPSIITRSALMDRKLINSSIEWLKIR